MNDYWNYLAHGELGKERKGKKTSYYTGSSASATKKRTHDNKTVRKAKRNLKNAAKKGKAKVASLLREAANKIDS